MKEWTIIQGDYSINILDVGAVLESFKYKDRDIIVGFKDKEEYYTAREQFSRVIGPVCNRLRNAQFSLDGRKYTLEQNNKKNNLHSGSKSFGYEIWSLKEVTDSSVTLCLHSPEKGGFPGYHDISVTYTLSKEGELSIKYRLSSEKPCPANVTNHAYFNLNGEGTVLDYYVKMPASYYLEVNSDLVPEEVKDVTDTDFDFRKGVTIGARRDGRYDHCFFLDDKEEVVVRGKDLELRMTTDLPAMQLYTAPGLNCQRMSKNGGPFKPFSAFCLETQFAPDFPNFPGVTGFYTGHGRVLETETRFKLVPTE